MSKLCGGLMILGVSTCWLSSATSQDRPAVPAINYKVATPITLDNVIIPDGTPDDLERFMSPRLLNEILRANKLGSDDGVVFTAFAKMKTAEKIFQDPRSTYRQKTTPRHQAATYAFNLLKIDNAKYRPIVESYIDHLVKTDPKSIGAQYGKAQLFAIDTNIHGGTPAPDIAARTVEFAKANPDSPFAKQFLDRIGKQLMGTRPKEALAAFKTAHALFPNDIAAHKWAAAIRRLELPGQPMKVVGPTLDGKTLDVESLKGKVVLIHFWGTFSGQSVREIAHLRQLYDKHREKGFEVVGISLDRARESVERFVRDRKLPWPQIYFEDYRLTGWENPIVKEYAVNQIPAAFLIGRDGKVSMQSHRLASEFDAVIEEELAK